MTDYAGANSNSRSDVYGSVLDDQLIDISPNVAFIDGYQESIRNSFCTKCRTINHSLFCASHNVSNNSKSFSNVNLYSEGNISRETRARSANHVTSYGNLRDDAPLINNFVSKSGWWLFNQLSIVIFINSYLFSVELG